MDHCLALTARQDAAASTPESSVLDTNDRGTEFPDRPVSTGMSKRPASTETPNRLVLTETPKHRASTEIPKRSVSTGIPRRRIGDTTAKEVMTITRPRTSLRRRNSLRHSTGGATT